MKKTVSALLLLIASSTGWADYAGILKVNRVRMDMQTVYFGTSTRPANTCSNWGEYFRFDHTTAAGKSFLSALLSAKAASQPIDVWYAPSSAPNTDQSNGCSGSAVSVLTGIGVR